MEEERENRKRDENVMMNGIKRERDLEFGGYRWKIRSG